MIYGYLFLTPFVLWCVLWWRGSRDRYTLLQLVAIYGYSISIFIPLTVTVHVFLGSLLQSCIILYYSFCGWLIMSLFGGYYWQLLSSPLVSFFSHDTTLWYCIYHISNIMFRFRILCRLCVVWVAVETPEGRERQGTVWVDVVGPSWLTDWLYFAGGWLFAGGGFSPSCRALGWLQGQTHHSIVKAILQLFFVDSCSFSTSVLCKTPLFELSLSMWTQHFIDFIIIIIVP